MTSNKKETVAKKTEKKDELLPFDELPVIVKRNRRLLYEYIRTGELPEQLLHLIFFFTTQNNGDYL